MQRTVRLAAFADQGAGQAVGAAIGDPAMTSLGAETALADPVIAPSAHA